jgi:hypothetical protein
VTVRAKNSRERAGTFGGAVEISRGEKSRETFEGDVFHGVSVAVLFVPNDWFQIIARGKGDEICAAENSSADVCGALFPFSACVPSSGVFGEFFPALIFGQERLFHWERLGRRSEADEERNGDD